LQIFASLKIRLENIFTFIEVNKEHESVVPLKLLKSIILIEDRRFNQHMGVDFYSICRATFNFIFKKKIEGASTLTQQLVRIVTNEREIKISRKVKEIILASLVEREYKKEEIILTYVLTYSFNKCNGIATLCNTEGYDVNCLNINEISKLVARLKYPSINNFNYLKYLKRVRIIEKYLLRELQNYSYVNETRDITQKDVSFEVNR
jgi:membrane carboxypeptidase/penicillin-binding protein